VGGGGWGVGAVKQGCFNLKNRFVQVVRGWEGNLFLIASAKHEPTWLTCPNGVFGSETQN
jgi:hypothetical protein